MNILNILENGELVFVEDAVESKKMRQLVEATNKSFTDMSNEIREFNEFANSQLKGEYHNKLVMAKSLKEYYTSWQAINLAYDAISKEEQKAIEKYTAAKTRLLNNLKTLAKETQREVAVSSYDLYDGEFKKCDEGHEVLILGAHGAEILDNMINNLNESLVVSGHFDEIEPKELDANYVIVKNNVSMCKQRSSELYGNKPNKLAKVDMTIVTMEEIGKKVVFFVTFKNDLLEIGCNPKFVNNYEKNLIKQYVPLKKTLQKELKVDFEEICNIVVDEATYPSADIDNPEDTQTVIERVEDIPAEELAVETAEEEVAETPAEEYAEGMDTEELPEDTDEVTEESGDEGDSSDVSVDTNIDDIE